MRSADSSAIVWIGVAAALLLTLLSPVRLDGAPHREQRPAPAAHPAPLPRVRLIATGGTISNRNEGRLTAEELVKSIPEVDRYATAEYEQFANVASGALSLDQWL